MGIAEIVLAINIAGTLAIGGITFFIVYTTFRGIEDKKIQRFSKRFTMSIAVLILYVSYFLSYNTFIPSSVIAKSLLYLLLVIVFLYMMWAAIGFEEVAQDYGVSQERKLEKMENEEIG